jgi:hypothetical protein
MAGVTLIPDPTQVELVRLSATASEITGSPAGVCRQ